RIRKHAGDSLWPGLAAELAGRRHREKAPEPRARLRVVRCHETSSLELTPGVSDNHDISVVSGATGRKIGPGNEERGHRETQTVRAFCNGDRPSWTDAIAEAGDRRAVRRGECPQPRIESRDVRTSVDPSGAALDAAERDPAVRHRAAEAGK